MNERDYRFFSVAKEMAALSTWSEIPREQVGAIIVLRNEVISTGYNRNKGSQVHGIFAERAGRPESHVAHAETSCLTKLVKQYGWSYSESVARDFELMKIYVYRETKQGIAMAKPCEICTMALKHFGIKHIFYSTKEGYAEEVWK